MISIIGQYERPQMTYDSWHEKLNISLNYSADTEVIAAVAENVAIDR